MKKLLHDAVIPKSGVLSRLSKFMLLVLFFLLLQPGLQAQVKLWGVTAYGGDGVGAIVSVQPDGSDFEATPLPFNAGAFPYFSDLIEFNGKFYGMTYSGGNNGYGVLFEYDPAGTGSYTVLHHFDGTNGANPYGSLIESGGKFYGMTLFGGNYSIGVIFEYDPVGPSYNKLHDFDNTNGAYPYGSLVESGGKFYGMTYSGGNNGYGVIFEYDPAGPSFNKLHDFDYTNGANPYGSLIESGGKFYGMTFGGGNNGAGVIFEYDPAGPSFNKLHDFDYTNGAYPYGSLIESGGKLYGMTANGGNNFYGVIFEYDPASPSFSKLHDFDHTNGANPFGSLIESGGKFYGMTYSGGSVGTGVLFEYDPAGMGSYSVKVHFNTGLYGSTPIGSLIESGGKFYGMTATGGNNGYGVIFEYDPAGPSYNKLHDFDNTNGAYPYGSLIVSGGKLYGMTLNGGNNGFGVIFEYDPVGPSFNKLHDFDNTNGAYPNGSLIESGGKLYGMTANGGNNGNGVIFEYDPAGPSFSKLHDFDDTNGANPYGSLIESGSKFYGMTANGGNNGTGVIFEYDPTGPNYNKLHDFDYTNGANPYGRLIESGGKFYGMTAGGGNNGTGVIFEYDPAGPNYNKLHDFDYANGAYPYFSLIESGGKFYGMTSYGGNNDAGVIFEYDPAMGGNYQVLKHLGGADGANPFYGQLIAVSGCVASDWYFDNDGDGYGDPLSMVSSCDQPPGYVADNTDCDDEDEEKYPGNPEVCDGKDNDCNGTIDDGVSVGVPTGINSTVLTATSVYLDWNDSPDADRWQVRYRVQGSATWTTTGNIFVSNTTLMGLLPNNIYQYQVRARCTNANNSAWSATYTFFTSTCGIPSGLAVSNITNNSALATWNAAAGVVSYMIRYRRPGYGWTVTSSATTSKTLTGLLASSNYEVQVASFCSGGAGAWSASVFFTTAGAKTDLLLLNNHTATAIDWTIFPNPAQSVQSLTIQLVNTQSETGMLSILDLQGRVIWRQNWSLEQGFNQLTLNDLNLHSGLYFVTIRLEEKMLTKRLIIQE